MIVIIFLAIQYNVEYTVFLDIGTLNDLRFKNLRLIIAQLLLIFLRKLIFNYFFHYF